MGRGRLVVTAIAPPSELSATEDLVKMLMEDVERLRAQTPPKRRRKYKALAKGYDGE